MCVAIRGGCLGAFTELGEKETGPRGTACRTGCVHAAAESVLNDRSK